MVHALEKTRKLLTPNGFVIEAHDVLQPRRIEVHRGARVVPAGELLDSSDFYELRQTNAAIEDVTDRGLFEIEAHTHLRYRFCAPSLAAFDQWLDAQWDTTYYPEPYAEIVRREMGGEASEGKVVIHAKARMIRMRACP